MNYKLEKSIGKKFGKWQVLSIRRSKYPSGKSCGHFYCRCECGIEKYCPAYDVTRGKSKQCTDCQYKEAQKRYKDLVGQKFGKWTVVKLHSRKDIKEDGYRKLIWECICDCGRAGYVQGSNLTGDLSNSCGLCDESKQLGFRLMKRMKHNAEVRNLEIDKRINGEVLIKLLKNQGELCALSGIPIGFGYNWKHSGTASLDRIDSSKGYLLDNIQWIHKDVNQMKMDLPEGYFIALCKNIAKTACRYLKIKGYQKPIDLLEVNDG